MFCPKCGDELVDVRGELTCMRGNMGLNKDMAERLTECFVSKTNVPEEKTYDFSWGGQWYCPGCGVAAREEDRGVVRCPGCKRSLSSFLYELIEIHPHVGRDY